MDTGSSGDDRGAGALSDDAVVARVRRGEVALYEVLMRRYNRRLYRAIRAIVRDEDETEDVMQEAYVRAFVNLEQFAGRSSFGTWVTRIAVNEALSRIRGRARLAIETADEEQLVGSADTERAAGAREIGRFLEAAVDALPRDYRVVFVLREIEQLGVRETAEVLALREETVKTRLHRARRLLRRGLEERLGAALVDSFEFAGTRCDHVVTAVLGRLAARPLH